MAGEELLILYTSPVLVFYSLPMQDNEQHLRIQEFLNREFTWKLAAGEANFLIQLLAFLVQENPVFVPDEKGVKRPLNYQSIRSIVLLNEKLSGQLQKYAADASVILGETPPPAPERVQ
ncbi:MAG: hypothetical protein EHM61_01485 [Acidobacteria bacterium]|nr:MAG: hypothetical protein EHM61_01485 [Acidobacteriota bacterium]